MKTLLDKQNKPTILTKKAVEYGAIFVFDHAERCFRLPEKNGQAQKACPFITL
ncbi:MAG: hypothetical protein J6M43_04975 [Neisseriaceae bacterium]|nr:hypothetical protein [Neisseriaceae bacterium]